LASDRYAAFLRGVNLGRRRRVSGEQLRARFEGLGFGEVGTFRTSGNVVFAAHRQAAAKLTDRIEKGLASALGYEVAVFLRSAAEMRALADHQPFTQARLKAAKGKLQVMLLSARPEAKVRRRVLGLATDEDALELGDRELYWLPSGGTRDSELDQKAIEALLGATTMRTKGTVDQLAAKYFAD
jgi:uncharacterized protein (DUF1697 family)